MAVSSQHGWKLDLCVVKFTRIVSFSGEQFEEWTFEIGGGPGVGKSFWARLSGYKQPAWGKIEGET